MAHARPFSTSKLQDLSNGIKNISRQGVLTPEIEFWVFKSRGGLPSPHFGNVSVILTLLQSGVTTAKKCTPTPCFSVVFILNLHLSLSKSLRTRHSCWGKWNSLSFKVSSFSSIRMVWAKVTEIFQKDAMAKPDALPGYLINLIESFKWKQWKGEELGHAP